MCRMKKYRNPIKDCGMYINKFYFYYRWQIACSCSDCIHCIPFLGMYSIYFHFPPGSLLIKLYNFKR